MIYLDAGNENVFKKTLRIEFLKVVKNLAIFDLQ